MVEDGFQEFRRRTEWYKCTSCTHEQVHPMPDMTGHYEGDPDNMTERPKNLILKEEDRGRRWFEYIKPPIERYVDIGAGAGASIPVIQKEFDIPYAIGVEPRPWHILFRCVQYISELEGMFDLVTCFHVLEHIEDPIAFLAEIKGIASGQVCIETPHYPSRGWPHLHVFTVESLLLTMDKAGMPAELCDAVYHIKVKHTVDGYNNSE